MRAYILVKRTKTITGAGADAATRNMDARNKQVTFIKYAPFTDCISEINDIQIIIEQILSHLILKQ